MSNVPLFIRLPPITRESAKVGFIDSGTAVPVAVAGKDIRIEFEVKDDTVEPPAMPVPEIFHRATIPAVELTFVTLLDPEVTSPVGVKALKTRKEPPADIVTFPLMMTSLFVVASKVSVPLVPPPTVRLAIETF